MPLEDSRLYRDLADREGRIRRLVDANILGIFIWNVEGAIIEANEAFLRMEQYGREDLVSGLVRWTNLTPTEWREGDERALAELKANRTVQPYEKEFFRKDVCVSNTWHRAAPYFMEGVSIPRTYQEPSTPE